MIKRLIKSQILDRLRHYPAVAVLGPRQVGKTTLAKTISTNYFDLELDEEKLRLDLEWNRTISIKKPIVLDEAQNHPEVFPRLRSAIDADRGKNGRFLILGSISPARMTHVSESLAGRIAICELSPISIKELTVEQNDALWLMGGYPDGGILAPDRYIAWQKNYLDLLAMRDLPSWGLPAKPQVTQRFFHMLAASHGNIWNANQIGKSLGISYHTVNAYLDYLEYAFLIRRIPPFLPNLRKRLVKSLKVYWRDSGLLHSLLKIETFEELIKQPWVGNSWEGWIIEQILIFLNQQDIAREGPYFFRTSDGYELDLVLRFFGMLWAIEIKLTASPGKNDFDRLSHSGKLIGADRQVLISRTAKTIEGASEISSNINGFLSFINRIKPR